jgi:predicted transcriptional regulator
MTIPAGDDVIIVNILLLEGIVSIFIGTLAYIVELGRSTIYKLISELVRN